MGTQKVYDIFAYALYNLFQNEIGIYKMRAKLVYGKFNVIIEINKDYRMLRIEISDKKEELEHQVNCIANCISQKIKNGYAINVKLDTGEEFEVARRGKEILIC